MTCMPSLMIWMSLAFCSEVKTRSDMSKLLVKCILYSTLHNSQDQFAHLDHWVANPVVRAGATHSVLRPEFVIFLPRSPG
jgi:hypothetical protein